MSSVTPFHLFFIFTAYLWLVICDGNGKLVVEMHTVIRISIVTIILFLAGARLSAQVVTTRVDSSKVASGKTVTEAESAAKGTQGAVNQQSGNAGAANKSKDVKAVRSSRPDMSKARGARPPVIVRPGGSGIPKGVGKPTGVGKKGGR